MPRKTTAETTTDEEILAYNNVPADVAAQYIGSLTNNSRTAENHQPT